MAFCLYVQQTTSYVKKCAEWNIGHLKNTALSGILGFLRAEQDVGNLNKNARSGIMGLLCAEQNVGNLRKWTFGNSGAPVRRTKGRKSQKMDFQEFWDSCAQNKTSEISTNALSGILGLLCAEQDVGNLKNDFLRIRGTPVRRTKRQKS